MALHNAPLGKSSEYPDQYDPSLLFPVAREENRRRIGLEDGRWPWFGEDLWHKKWLHDLPEVLLPLRAMGTICPFGI